MSQSFPYKTFPSLSRVARFGYVILLMLGPHAEITATRPAGSREISSDLGKGRTNEGYEHDKDDDWLDGMLGGR